MPMRPAETLACASAVALDGAAGAPEWVQLLADGINTPRDGRDPWRVADKAKVIAASKLPLMIDAEHGKLLLPRGTAVPAMGWIEALAAQGPAGEPGLWGRVAWTPEGATAIAAKAYRYISPVFAHTKAGIVTRIDGAAIVNDPALPDLKALASAEPPRVEQEKRMDLGEIADALGLAPDADIGTALAAIVAQRDELKSLRGSVKAVASALGLKEGATGDELVTAASSIKTGQGEIDALQKQLASVISERAAEKAEAAADAAIADGRLIPAQRDWAVSYASRDPEGFAVFAKAQPKVLAAGATAARVTEGGDALSAEEVAICASLGLAHKDFIATRKSLAAQEA
jgi:phage I-like protein